MYIWIETKNILIKIKMTTKFKSKTMFYRKPIKI